MEKAILLILQNKKNLYETREQIKFLKEKAKTYKYGIAKIIVLVSDDEFEDMLERSMEDDFGTIDVQHVLLRMTTGNFLRPTGIIVYFLNKNFIMHLF